MAVGRSLALLSVHMLGTGEVGQVVGVGCLAHVAEGGRRQVVGVIQVEKHIVIVFLIC